jgi:translocation and assembly module TamA
VAALLALLPLGAAHASIEILIPDVTDQIQNNVRAFLSLTRYAERDDITPETMSRLQRRIVAETQEALEPLGYYEPRVSYETKHDLDKWTVTIHVMPGRPVRLSDVSVTATGPGANVRDIRDIIEAQELKPGLRLNHGTYERVKGTLLRAAKNEGYLDARLTKNELMIDRTERRATVTIEMDTGKRYSFGEIKIAQDVINDHSMRRLLRMQQGDPYTLDALLRTQYTLDDSQYFSNVSIESGTPDREALTIPVTVSAQPNRKHRFATSVGYGTDTEARGKFTWDNRRVNRDGHRLKVELLGSSVIKEISARYVIPVMDVALEKVEFTADLVDEDIGDTESKRNEVGAGLTQAMGRWQRVLFVRLSNETTTDTTGTNTAFYVFPGISYSTLPSYITGGRPRPYRLYFELRGSPTTLGSDASFVQFRFQGERKFDFWQRWHLDLRSELGMTRIESNRPQNEQILDLPASQRFFAGGDRSVRGFDLNELAPRDPRDPENGETIGGKHLATGTIEVTRDLPRNFGVAAFYDIGNAFNDFKAPDFEYSVGMGVRYNIAVARFGIDVAQPLSESGRSPKFHLYISTQF